MICSVPPGVSSTRVESNSLLAGLVPAAVPTLARPAEVRFLTQ